MSWGKHRQLQNFCGFHRKKNGKFDEDSNESFVTIYYKIIDNFLEYDSPKDSLIKHKWLSSN